MKNWQTTIMGGVPGIGVVIDGIMTKNWGQVAGGIGLILVAIFAKDAGKTGEGF